MWFKTGKVIVVGYGVLLTLAAGGFVCANLAGFFRGVIQFAMTYGDQKAPDPTVVQTWTHAGWVFGVGIALLGAIVKFRKSRKKRSRKPQDHTEQDANALQKSEKGRRLGPVASSALGSLGGGLLGGIIGGTLIMLWFSLTYSPFAPHEWVSSVSVERRRTGVSGRKELVHTTDHPVALYAFGVPLVLGGIAGAVFGGLGGVYLEK